MKKTLKLLPFFLCALFTFSTTSCSDDDNEEVCEALKQTDKPAACSSADISVCSDDNKTYYTFNGTDYDTVDGLVNACAPNASAAQFKSISIQLDAATQKLLNEVRLSAVCD